MTPPPEDPADEALAMLWAPTMWPVWCFWRRFAQRTTLIESVRPLIDADRRGIAPTQPPAGAVAVKGTWLARRPHWWRSKA